MTLIANSATPTSFPSLAPVGGDPTKDIRAGLMVLSGFAAIFTGWSVLAPLDAAAIAPGQISVSGHDQVVQHREGGVVASVDVVEGQQVRAGQVLVELAPEDVGAQFSSLRSEFISLQAQRARLTAEVEGARAITWPDAFSTMTGDDLAAAKEAIASQQAQFYAGLRALSASESINVARAASLKEQIAGSQGQLDANTRQQALLDQELTGVRGLAQKGYASLNSVRALERSDADLAGAQKQYAANIADYQQQIMEAGLQSRTLESQRGETAAAALHETEDQLNTIAPKLDAARLQLARGTLRAQTDGTVTGLDVFTAGAVVAPGQKLMEIVPSHPVLTVEARLAASDIEGVHPGQKAEVRFSSLSGHGVPVLIGALTEISADSFTDDKTGQAYYTAEVSVPKSQLDLVARIPGADSALRPGVPVQVMIPLRKRTVWDYLFEPLSQSLWKAFRQS